jgi:hypothetical protein
VVIRNTDVEGGNTVSDVHVEHGNGADRSGEVATRPMSTQSTGSVITEAQPVQLDESNWTPPSWDEVVREHADRVYRLAYRLTGNAHDAEDLTQ